MNLIKFFIAFKNKEFGIQPAAVLILIMIAFGACKKDSLPYGEGTKLVKVIARQDDSVGVAVFDYDVNDRLISIHETVNNKSGNQTYLQYDNLGRLIQSDHMYVPTNYTWSANYSYMNDQIVQKLESDGFGVKSKNVYTYDLQGRLIADTLYRYMYTNSTYISFKYNPSGNIEEAEHFINYTGTWEKDKWGDEQAVYNNEMNPYTIGLYFLKGYREYNSTHLSKNLPTQYTTSFATKNYNYEYHSNGLLKKASITTTYTNGSEEVSSIEFYYK